MQRIVISVVLLFLVFGAAGYYFFNNQKKAEPTPLPQGSVCDKDTMVCEDGTILHRQGLNCDFPPCPASGSASSPVSTVAGSATPIPSATGQDISILGEMICLPHRNTSGPQTLECAFGLKGVDGNNYTLNDPGWKYLMGVGTNTKIEIKGKLNEKQDEKYISVGVITIEGLRKI